MTRTARLLPLLLGALLLAGCSTSDNTPESYPDRTAGEDEQDGNDYQVWENYLAACTEANADLEPEEARDVCTCTWDAFEEDVPFEVFIEFDRTIQERIADVGDNVETLRQIAENVVDDYNRDLPEGEDRIDVDLIELIEDCQPQVA